MTGHPRNGSADSTAPAAPRAIGHGGKAIDVIFLVRILWVNRNAARASLAACMARPDMPPNSGWSRWIRDAPLASGSKPPGLDSNHGRGWSSMNANHHVSNRNSIISFSSPPDDPRSCFVSITVPTKAPADGVDDGASEERNETSGASKLE